MIVIHREWPGRNIPLVLVACRDCETHSGEDCPTCENQEQVLVDEVFASDEVLDADAYAAYSAYWDNPQAEDGVWRQLPMLFVPPVCLERQYEAAMRALPAPEAAS